MRYPRASFLEVLFEVPVTVAGILLLAECCCVRLDQVELAGRLEQDLFHLVEGVRAIDVKTATLRALSVSGGADGFTSSPERCA